ncbi:phenolic acid decarboxylase [Nocardia uniformis]|uniref:Phenolic acid decarboxylase n=1 Tax=Nocardia uniformis TaxID=53432 RepID=A0A849C9N4_9NOCA|nr:phenolic acid decarboxylase [Nocardia uniformis]NNH73080.1 phenolic acid decarboxylase [Nocardia uniformis]
MSAGPTSTSNSALTGDLSGLIGKHLIYAYENGWKYELYVRNAETIESRCLMGPMFGRWSKNQSAKFVQLSGDLYKLAWVEPTGTTTNVILWLSDRRVHTTISYPQWMLDYPESTLGRYEDNLAAIIADRERGPTYPLTLVSSTGRITYLETRDPDDDTVIDRPPNRLPPGYADRTN